jgi:DNA mismatch repair protein MutS
MIDRLFTRVGASDNLVRGQSTFMVEMSETSAILHTASERSLVLLDEIGRGTSTYDGISIAWSVSEHLHNAIKCKTIFATHYHELTQLADSLVAVRNYNVQVREIGDQVLFLHRLEPGGADRSYGIEVGRLAGLPPVILARARQLLGLLEAEQIVPRSPRGAVADKVTTNDQLGLFAVLQHRVVDELRTLDPNKMTPIQSLELLARLVDEVKRDAREG